MSYVPPHLRNRKEKTQPKEVMKPVESDFPVFVTEKVQTSFKGLSFREKVVEAPKVETFRDVEPKIAVYNPRFTGFDRRESPEDDIGEYDFEPIPEVKKEDDGWQTVERKVRIKRDRVQDALDNGDAPVEDEGEDSSWNDQQEEHETYWDERRH